MGRYTTALDLVIHKVNLRELNSYRKRSCHPIVWILQVSMPVKIAHHILFEDVLFWYLSKKELPKAKILKKRNTK